ncbi:unknown protein [Seminavis robusta]|uniref:Uncharacterized protein n=1 Tax=Seminavis robusta TaxID=568900 RepID=A0A9N8F2V3_9STRA|nr:unknown protein [Seminavis robusta]|eukprot:Sro2817_g337780.1 n/a (97) ;mRNA; r:5827-6117
MAVDIIVGGGILECLLVGFVSEAFLGTMTAHHFMLTGPDVVQDLDIGEGTLQEQLLHAVTELVARISVAIIVVGDGLVKLDDKVNSRALPWTVLDT